MLFAGDESGAVTAWLVLPNYFTLAPSEESEVNSPGRGVSFARASFARSEIVFRFTMFNCCFANCFMFTHIPNFRCSSSSSSTNVTSTFATSTLFLLEFDSLLLTYTEQT